MTSDHQPLDTSASPRVAVVGGGISGLAAAHRLHELIPQASLSLFEASGRLGGVLQTRRQDGFLIEQSADNFLTRQSWATDYCRRIGLGEELLCTNESHRRAFVVCKGRLEPVPSGFVLMAPRKLAPLLRSRILSPTGKLRLLCEPLIPRRKKNFDEVVDESVASFARRRLGTEAFERLVQPLLSGIYTADPEYLSMAATMPQFLEHEQRYGRILLTAETPNREGTAAAHESGARYSLFVAPRSGMSRLVEASSARLPGGALQLNDEVQRVIQLETGGWQLATSSQAARQEFDALILATPAHVSGHLLRQVDTRLATLLGDIDYASSVVVSVGWRRDQIAHPLDGFGLVVPQIEHRKIIATSFASIKFIDRAPEGNVLVRVFIGGALQPELTELDDGRLVDLALEELGSLLGTTGEPQLVDVARWPDSMPQYHVGHVARVAQIETIAARYAGLALAGNAFHGVGIPQCIHSGEQAAQQIVSWLARR